MAQKKKSGTEVAIKGNSAAVKVDPNLPKYLAGYKGPRGTESIESGDITIPRIKLGQGTSDEVKDGTLKEGAIFLNLTKEVLAEPGKPLRGVPVARAKEYILWRPRKDNGGGILARAKPVVENGQIRYKWDKPNQSFDVKVDGKVKATWTTKNYIDEDGLDQWGSEIPGNAESGIAATAHHNYILVLPDNDDMVAALSLSRSSAKKAKDYNALLKLGSAPMWARVFTFQSIDEQNDQGKFKNYKIENAGFATEEEYARYAGMASAFAGKSFNVDHTDGDDEPAGGNGAL